MWYDGSKVLEKGSLFNFIVGGRGIGKSFFWKRYCLERFRDHGEQFIYLRRYKEELKGDKLKRLFNDLQAAGYFTENTIEIKGREIYFDKKVCGYIQALSTALIAKSDSFPNVETILFDEFLIETGTYHYLKNEVESLIGFYETVARNRPDVSVYLLSNAITVSNPYFAYFRIQLPMKGARIWRRGEVLLDMPRDDEFIEMRKKSRFHRLIEGTDYADYSIENNFLLDNDTFIEKKTSQSIPACNFLFNGAIIGMWLDNSNGIAYCSFDHDDHLYTYSMSTGAHTYNTILTGRIKPYHVRLLIDQYRAGCLRCENQKIKGIMMDYLGRAG